MQTFSQYNRLNTGHHFHKNKINEHVIQEYYTYINYQGMSSLENI